MMNSKWKLVALAAVMLMSPGVAGAKDNVGGGGDGGCRSCATNPFTNDSWCVAYGTGYSNLFGMTKCKDDTERVGFHFVKTCALSGSSCMGGRDIPVFPAYL